MPRRVLFYFLLFSFLLSSLSLFYYFDLSGNELQVSFLDVGQGDSILIETPNNQNILIDGGPDDKILTRLGRALPFWDRTIDLMVLTHPHADHVSGLVKVLPRYEVKKVLYPRSEYSSPVYSKWKELIRREKADIQRADILEKIKLGDNCSLEVVHKGLKKPGDVNNDSLVTRLDCFGKRFLFTGDIEGEIKREIVARSDGVGAGVLKVAHHGAGEGKGSGFIDKVSPSIAVVSVGKNDYGHPDKNYLRFLERKGVKVLRTDKRGTIIFTKTGEESFIEFGGHDWKNIFY